MVLNSCTNQRQVKGDVRDVFSGHKEDNSENGRLGFKVGSTWSMENCRQTFVFLIQIQSLAANRALSRGLFIAIQSMNLLFIQSNIRDIIKYVGEN